MKLINKESDQVGRNQKFASVKKQCFLLVTGLLLINLNTVSVYAEWHFGIGTGPMRLNSKGDQGFHTNLAGPVEFDVDLAPDDFSDLTSSAIGLGGYATDGKWRIQYSIGKLELEDDAGVTTANGSSIHAELGFDITAGELIIGYPIYQSDACTVLFHGGVRYTKHELDSDVTVTVTGLGTTRIKRDIDEDWTDAVVGFSADMPFAEKWTWSNRIDAGFGGSDGTYLVYTGLTWRFFEHWSGTLYGKYTAVDFEDGSKGDAGWYLYDVDEFGPGLNILYHW